MNPYQEIFRSLKQAAQNRKKIKLLSVYKGLPVLEEVTIQRVLDNALEFKVSENQATSLEVDRQAFLEIEGLPSVVRAGVSSVNFLTNTVVMTAFIYSGKNIGNRELIRVQPANPISVEMLFKRQRIGGEIEDLSIEGVALSTDALLYSLNFFSVGTEIWLLFELPEIKPLIKVRGFLKNTAERSGIKRLGVSTRPDGHTRMLIGRYITRRQVEIKRELENMYRLYYKAQIDAQMKKP